MTAAVLSHRGLVVAEGFLFDLEVIGESEARRRVLEHWADGAELRAFPGGRWLLSLATPVAVRVERAPGHPLVRTAGGGLTSPGAPADTAVLPGRVTCRIGGIVRTTAIAELPLLAPAGWLDLTGLRVVELAPLQEPEPAADPVDPITTVEPPDLRKAARVRERRVRPGSPPGLVALLLAGILAWAAWFGLAVGLVLALVALVAVAVAAHVPGAVFVVAGGVVARTTSKRLQARAARQGATGAGRPGRARTSLAARLRDLTARLALRTSAAALVRRRHERYLRRLEADFQKRAWDDALRDAISLGEESDERGLLTLRLPAPRTKKLSPTAVRKPAGPRVPYGTEIRQRLRELYEEAAKQLEAEGRIEEAAFVLADLMMAPGDAVTVLERHGRLRLAAELAEGRELAPDLVVRLWWRAGDRDRAVTVARARGAFATAVQRLAAVDPNAARLLRTAWVRERQAAGDHSGAVSAAWPDPELRELVVTDLQQGMALGGPPAARLFAHLAAFRPNDSVREAALALLDGQDEELRSARAAFAMAFAGLDCADPAADRSLATAALRSYVRDAGWPAEGPAVDRARLTLAERADPLVAADLARAVRSAPQGIEPLTVAAGTPGSVRVHDAVAMAGGVVLVACGEAGTYLLSGDGRIRARWDVPAHRLVVADHGGSAMLVTRRESLSDLHRLDLPTRKIIHWATLRVNAVLPSFDGGLLVTLDDDGLGVLDVLADRPRVVWRELARDVRVPAVSRTPESVAALLTGAEGDQAWRWEMPSWTLRSRRATGLDPNETLAAGILADGTLISVTARAEAITLRVHHESGPEERQLPEGGVRLLTDGLAYALTRDGQASVHAPGLQLEAGFPGSPATGIGLRHHAGITTLWDAYGRVIAVAPHGQVVANLSVRSV